MAHEIPDLTETELAIIDAIKALAEAMLLTGLTTPRNLEAMFVHQQQGYLAKHLLRGAAVFETLLLYVRNPEHEAGRQQLRSFLRASSEGSA